MSFNPEKLTIRKIDVESFELRNSLGYNSFDLEGFDIETEQEVQIGFNTEIKTAKVTIVYHIIPAKDKVRDVSIGARITINFFISIDNYDDLVIEKDGKLEIDNHLYVNLVAVSFSTGRGLIYARLHSTHLENIILPVIDPKKLVKED